jgi:uncharacterized protein
MIRTQHTRRSLVLAMICVLPAPAFAVEKTHRLALQVSDNDADKMNAVLNVAVNVSQHYSAKGEEVSIQIVAFNAGLHMLRDDTSPVKERLQSFAKSMPDVSFKACGNTLQAMTKREGKALVIVSQAEIVPAGVVTLMELAEQGWTIVRP